MKDRLGQLRLRFAELRLARDGDRVQVYAGKDFSGHEVSVAVLAESAAADPGLRQAFAQAVGRAGDTGGPSVQSDVHAAVPWFAARHPGGPAVILRFIAEVDRHRPAMPAGSVALAPLPVDAPPPPVRPDPTIAPAPPLIDLQPAVPAPLAPNPPPAPQPPPPPRPVPAQRRASPPSPVPRAPARVTKPSMSPSTIITVVVVGLVVLVMCCSSGLGDLLG